LIPSSTAAWYYDNLEPTPLDDAPQLVELERIYCLDFPRFSERDWARLDEIYRSLPGDYRICHTPMWFGADEDNPPFLWASVEEPGLQVYGVLALSDWSAWDRAFFSALAKSELPFRMRKDG
jgi:hypothetical protein